MQSGRDVRVAVHRGEWGPPSVADVVPAAAATVEFCGFNVF